MGLSSLTKSSGICVGRNATIIIIQRLLNQITSSGDCTSIGAVSQAINQGQQVRSASDTPIQISD